VGCGINEQIPPAGAHAKRGGGLREGGQGEGRAWVVAVGCGKNVPPSRLEAKHGEGLPEGEAGSGGARMRGLARRKCANKNAAGDRQRRSLLAPRRELMGGLGKRTVVTAPTAMPAVKIFCGGTWRKKLMTRIEMR